MAICFAVSAGSSLRAEVSETPSTYTYYNLKTVGEVQNRNLDEAFWKANVKGEHESQPFLSTVKHLVNSNKLPQTIASTWTQLDPVKFTLAESYGVRAYFVGEDTSFHNSLGFNASGQGISGGNPLLIFPNASTAVKFANADSSKLDNELRNKEPLFPGDFVDLASGDHGQLAKGTTLDFFMIRDGFATNPGSGARPDVLSASTGHLVAFAKADNPYVLIGFEDGLGPVDGKSDFSDALFAIDMGVDNVKSFLANNGGFITPSGVPAPEPGIIWALVLGAGGMLQRIRRKRASVTATVA